MSAVTFELPEDLERMFDNRNQRVYMHNRNINEEEIQILKDQDRFTKCDYVRPCEDPEVIGGSF
tara:strand:- start:6276 stop:6467 length:192 start_codon:yes stop_codon:yes gene_type:complete